VTHFKFIENFTDPETRVFQAADSEDSVNLTCTVYWLIHLWDRQTDRRKDRIAMAKTRY